MYGITDIVAHIVILSWIVTVGSTLTNTFLQRMVFLHYSCIRIGIRPCLLET